MDDRLLDRLVALLYDSGLSEIELEDGDTHIHLVKDGHATEAPMPIRPAVAAAPEPASQETHAIVAGLTGTFYRASSPETPPFVEIGDRVTEGQTIGLLEAMKMLNPIEADRAGRVVFITAENGAPVTRGAVLFRIATPDAPS